MDQINAMGMLCSSMFCLSNRRSKDVCAKGSALGCIRHEVPETALHSEERNGQQSRRDRQRQSPACCPHALGSGRRFGRGARSRCPRCAFSSRRRIWTTCLCCNSCVGVDGRRGIDGKIGQKNVQGTELLPKASVPIVLALRPMGATSRSVVASGTLLRSSFCRSLKIALNLVSRERRNLHSLSHPLRCQTLVKILSVFTVPYRSTSYFGQDSRISGIDMGPFVLCKEDGHG